MLKPKLSEAKLRKLEWTRVRQKAWREKPDHMEAIRVRATNAAAAKKQRRIQNLIAALSTLPAAMTTDELRDAVTKSNYRGKFHSMTNRLRRHGLMLYDAAAGVWVNQCVPEREQS
ncbi:MAG: hypothetical protein RIR91_1661 [Verrucomicrobiota bacterium]